MNNDILQLQYLVDQNIEKVIQEFDLKLNKFGKFYVNYCPIHSGDNPTAFNIDARGHKVKWCCWTKNCHETFQKTSLGLVRALLSSQKLNWTGPGDKTYGWNNTLNWCKKFLGVKNSDLNVKLPENKEEEFIIPDPEMQLTRTDLRDKLVIPSSYFLDRGFCEEILDFYDVGRFKEVEKGLAFRELVPVYDLEGKYCIGGTARTVFPLCSDCNCYHDPHYYCPKEEFRSFYCKWKNWKFKRQYSLYNYWYAQKAVHKAGRVILVESPGNVWRLAEAGIDNVVATYGNKLCHTHKILLNRLFQGIHEREIVIGYDNDKAGEEGFKQAGKELWQEFTIKKIQYVGKYNDFGEMPIDLIREEYGKYG